MKKYYITPAVIVCTAKISSMLMTSGIQVGGDQGKGETITGDAKGGMWDGMSEE